MKKNYWITNVDTVLKIAELAIKEKITMQQAFEKLLKKGEIKPEYLGNGEMDGDLLTGNLREQGIRVKNFNEEIRKNEKKKTKKKNSTN